MESPERRAFGQPSSEDDSDWSLSDIDNEHGDYSSRPSPFLSSADKFDSIQFGESDMMEYSGSTSEQWMSLKDMDVWRSPCHFAPPPPVKFTVSEPCNTVSPFSLFSVFFSNDFVSKLCKITSQYVQNKKQNGELAHNFQLPEDFGPTCFYHFLGVLVYMGLYKFPKIEDYFIDEIAPDFIRKVPLTLRGFRNILQSLRFTTPEYETQKQSRNSRADRVWKVFPLIDHVRQCCKNFMKPKRELSVEEHVSASGIFHTYKHQMTTDLKICGFKLWVLFSPDSKYVHNFHIYRGQRQDVQEAGLHDLTYTAVRKLLDGYSHTGHVVYVPSRYTDPQLFENLLRDSVYCVGAIRPSQKGFPHIRRNSLNTHSSYGSARWYRNGNIVYIQWMDRYPLTVASTYHSATATCYVEQLTRDKKRVCKQGGILIVKPKAVIDFVRNKPQLDLSNHIVSNFKLIEEAGCWYRKVFLHCVDIAVSNAYALYTKACGSQRTDSLMSHADFRRELARELCFLHLEPTLQRDTSGLRRATIHKLTMTKTPRPCATCTAANRVTQTSYVCSFCDVPLCHPQKMDCFVAYHKYLDISVLL